MICQQQIYDSARSPCFAYIPSLHNLAPQTISPQTKSAAIMRKTRSNSDPSSGGLRRAEWSAVKQGRERRNAACQQTLGPLISACCSHDLLRNSRKPKLFDWNTSPGDVDNDNHNDKECQEDKSEDEEGEKIGSVPGGPFHDFAADPEPGFPDKDDVSGNGLVLTHRGWST